MKAHKEQACPACGKVLPMWRNLVEHRRGDNGPYREIVGRAPAFRKYDPFCTLRCALAYARTLYDRYGHMYKKSAQ